MARKNPLSFVDVSSSVLFTEIAKRLVRLLWILAANGCVAWFMSTRLVSVGFSGGVRDPELWLEFFLEVAVPVAGIALEVVNWKFARWVNVGCFTVAGCLWLGEAIWWHSDPFFGVLLIIACGLLIIAGLTEIVYRQTRSDSSCQTNS
jgi:hypothetical protein